MFEFIFINQCILGESIMYQVGNGIKNGKRLTQNASSVFESNMKDINFIHLMISNFRENYPDYILKIEEYYQMDIEQILKKFTDSKADLIKIIRDFEQMIDSINKFNQDRALNLTKVRISALPKFSSEVVEMLKTGSLEEKIDFLLAYIDKSNKNNSDNVAYTIKEWDSPSRKEFEGDIEELRNNSIEFFKQGLLSVPTTITIS